MREHRKLSVVVSRTVQQQTPMMGVATFLTNMDSGDMNARIQWSNALMAGGQQALDQLETRQIALSKARDVEKQARDRVAREKQAVEDLLERKQQAESAAGTAKQDVAAAVTANEQAKKSADAKLAGERKHQDELRAEEDQLDKRIKELKAVLFWLEQNGTALKATIQALEVQKMTLAALAGMNLNMAEVAKAFTITRETLDARDLWTQIDYALDHKQIRRLYTGDFECYPNAYKIDLYLSVEPQPERR